MNFIKLDHCFSSVCVRSEVLRVCRCCLVKFAHKYVRVAGKGLSVTTVLYETSVTDACTFLFAFPCIHASTLKYFENMYSGVFYFLTKIE